MTLPSSGLITINDRGARSATTFGSVEAGGGNMVFIKKLTASSSATLSFVDGASSVVLDSTYKEYMFTFNNIHPATDNAEFSFQGNAAGGSGYNETITSTQFETYHTEDGTSTSLAYKSARDQAQGTGFQTLSLPTHENDNGASGYLHLFNPSSTTFVKHFLFTGMTDASGDTARPTYAAGFGNTTSAVDAIQFTPSAGTIDAGTIQLFGVVS